MTADPTPTLPKFAIGSLVWSYNGQPRIVTSMRWTAAMKRSPEDVEAGAATGLPHPDEPDVYGWALDTVDPDDPTCKGGGFEETYRPRVAGESSPGPMWAAHQRRMSLEDRLADFNRLDAARTPGDWVVYYQPVVAATIGGEPWGLIAGPKIVRHGRDWAYRPEDAMMLGSVTELLLLANDQAAEIQRLRKIIDEASKRLNGRKGKAK